MKPSEKTRRSFLKNAAAISAASAFPSIITKAAGPWGAPYKKAGEKVNLACVGIGNQGGSDVKSFAKTGLANFVAFCDVDMGAPQTQKCSQMFRVSRISGRCSIKWVTR
jgi:hypothetical protein